MQEDWSQWVSQAWVAGTTALEILFGLLLMIVLTVYFVHSGDLLMEWVRSLFPRRSRVSIKAASEVAYGSWGAMCAVWPWSASSTRWASACSWSS